MDQGTRLAPKAIVQGLQRSGHLGTHALAVIVDELRYASREAHDSLFDHEGTQIERLAEELQHGGGDDGRNQNTLSEQIRRVNRYVRAGGSVPSTPPGSPR